MRWLGVIGAGVVLALACSSEDGGSNAPGKDPGCGQDPWACGAGETCWPVSLDGHLECINAPTDQVEGAPCQFIVNQAMCAPHLYCFPAAQNSTSGVCSPFCNQGVCLNGGTCVQVYIQGGTEKVQVCTPNAGDAGTGGDAGTDASVGGTGGVAGSGGTAGTSAGGTAGTSSGGTAGTSSGGTAGTSSGGSAGQSGSAGAGP
jgi:hypothetical protein